MAVRIWSGGCTRPRVGSKQDYWNGGHRGGTRLFLKGWRRAGRERAGREREGGGGGGEGTKLRGGWAVQRRRWWLRRDFDGPEALEDGEDFRLLRVVGFDLCSTKRRESSVSVCVKEGGRSSRKQRPALLLFIFFFHSRRVSTGRGAFRLCTRQQTRLCFPLFEACEL